MDGKLHPELIIYFAGRQREQQHYVQAALVARTVRQTAAATLTLLDRMAERGVQMDEATARADALVRDSERFAREAEGENAYFCCYWVPRWWCQRVNVTAQWKRKAVTPSESGMKVERTPPL